MPTRTDLPVSVLAGIRDRFTYTKRLADGAIAQCTDAQLAARLSGPINSIATIMNHLAGNMLSRWTDFRTTDGEKPGRDRDTEFAVVASLDRAALLSHWERGWACLFAAIDSVQPHELDQPLIRIRGEAMTLFDAVNRQTAHYSYHVGQITLLAHHFHGESGWKYLTIAPGQSQQFNASVGHTPPR